MSVKQVSPQHEMTLVAEAVVAATLANLQKSSIEDNKLQQNTLQHRTLGESRGAEMNSILYGFLQQTWTKASIRTNNTAQHHNTITHLVLELLHRLDIFTESNRRVGEMR